MDNKKIFRGSPLRVCDIFFWTIVCLLSLNVSSQNTEVPNTSTIQASFNAVDKTKNKNITAIPLVHLNLCLPGDNISSTYCSCRKEVVSCDLSAYPALEHMQMEVHGTSMEPSIKRLCLCNSPRNILLNLKNDLIPRHSDLSFGIHRVDLTNIQGPLHFTGPFSLNFSGDLYMSNISYLNSIDAWEFGRGYDMEIQDVSGLECCSKINASKNYRKPTLYLENSKIGTIKSNSINGVHLWKTVIMNGVTIVHSVQSFGIKLASENLNVSFSLCNFYNVSDYGIEIEKFENLVVSKSEFIESSPLSFLAISTLPNSTLVIVDNLFNNVMTWQLDAHRVMCWYNMFDFWYSDTFEFLHKTVFPDRVFSIEYNTVGHFLINETSNIPALLPGDSVIFHENVLGICNCSEISHTVIPDILGVNPSRCAIRQMEDTNKKGNCLIDYKSAMTSCQKDSTKEPEFSKMCNDRTIAISSFDTKPFTNGTIKAGISIDSPFINEMIKDTKYLFHIHQVSSHSESEEEKEFVKSTSPSSTNSNQNDEQKSRSGGHTTLYVFLTMGIVFLVLVAGWVFKKQRHSRLLRFGQTLSESYDVLTTST